MRTVTLIVIYKFNHLYCRVNQKQLDPLVDRFGL